MNIVEKTVMTIIFGSVLPILLFIAGWWGSFRLVPEKRVIIFAIFGLGLGILADALLLRKWLHTPYQTNSKILLLIYLFYSIGSFGFFMGVPVFNLLIGMAAGIFTGRQACLSQDNIIETKHKIAKVSVFTSVIMIIFCILSAVIALRDPIDTARNLEGMFRIQSFMISTAVIIGIIVIGGFLLVFFQYWLTRQAALIAYGIQRCNIPIKQRRDREVK